MNNNTSDSGGPDSKPERALPEPFSAKIDVDVFAMSHQGHVRTKNEDHFLVARGGRNLETVFSNLDESRPGDRFEETAYGMIVADGVGGEAAGEVASREAIFNLLNLALRTPDWQFRWGPKEKNTDVANAGSVPWHQLSTARTGYGPCSSSWNVHDADRGTHARKGSRYRSHR